MSEYRKINSRDLEERIVFLQSTLATLKAQLDAQNSLDNESVTNHPASIQLLATQPPAFSDTPLAIAAG
ncbi:MAG TPA: hypothetical protein VLO13_04860 [Halomonas sp.]|nr:hypothetical protein [Halomonas sp.]